MRYVRERLNDILAGLVTLGVGLFIALQGRSYGVGQLRDMGAGYFPVVIGCAMIALSVIMVLTAKPDETEFGTSWHQIRGMIFVTAGFAAFALTIETLGMVVAVTLAVLLSALANRATRPLTALLLALATALACVLVFNLGLGLQIKAY